jgi:hypothetical protein
MTALYAFFWLGLAYHALITFVSNGSSSSAGWYLYGIVATEVLLFGLGLSAALPQRLRPWALPVTTLSFSLLDLYTVHFLFIPYYTGLIAHRPDGALATFAVSRIWSGDLWLLPSRLLVNKPLDNILFFPLLWACYFAATVTIVGMSFRRVRLRG